MVLWQTSWQGAFGLPPHPLCQCACDLKPASHPRLAGVCTRYQSWPRLRRSGVRRATFRRRHHASVGVIGDRIERALRGLKSLKVLHISVRHHTAQSKTAAIYIIVSSLAGLTSSGDGYQRLRLYSLGLKCRAGRAGLKYPEKSRGLFTVYIY